MAIAAAHCGRAHLDCARKPWGSFVNVKRTHGIKRTDYGITLY